MKFIRGQVSYRGASREQPLDQWLQPTPVDIGPVRVPLLERGLDARHLWIA